MGVSTVGQCLRVPQTPVNASERGQQRSLEQPAQAVLLPLLRQGHLWAPLHCSWHLEHTPAGLLNPSLPGPVPGGQLRSVHGRRTLLCAVVANSVLTRADAPRRQEAPLGPEKLQPDGQGSSCPGEGCSVGVGHRSMSVGSSRCPCVRSYTISDQVAQENVSSESFQGTLEMGTLGEGKQATLRTGDFP